MLSLNSCRVRRFTLIVAVILAAAIGSMASTSAGTDSWYLLLEKSDLNPPSYVFGIVWLEKMAIQNDRIFMKLSDLK